MMFRERSTPIEAHMLAPGLKISVKRDDLFAKPPAPPLAKLRGIRGFLSRAKADGVSLVGVFEARASTVGHALAAACLEYDGITPIVGYPRSDRLPETRSVRKAVELGAIPVAVPWNVMNVCYAQVRKQVEARGGRMVPFGFEFPEAVQGVQEEAASVPEEKYVGGCVVLAAGSGVTTAGIIRGLSAAPASIVAVSTGRSLSRISACLKRWLDELPSYVALEAPLYRYADMARVEPPFPCDPYYDAKAWEYLVDHAEDLPKPILFWNVGG